MKKRKTALHVAAIIVASTCTFGSWPTFALAQEQTAEPTPSPQATESDQSFWNNWDADKVLGAVKSLSQVQTLLDWKK